VFSRAAGKRSSLQPTCAGGAPLWMKMMAGRADLRDALDAIV
jgi:hypothetical protein